MLKKITLFAIISIALLIITLQFPNLYLEKQFEYENFQIYSNESIELDENVKSSLDSVNTILEKSRFHYNELKLELYFVKGTLYQKLIGVFGRKNIASSKFNKHIYIGKPDFKNNILLKEDNQYEWLNLIQIISHEGVHSQMYKDFSTFGFMKTPSWINEGYSEYISYKPIRKEKDYDLLDLLKRYDQQGDPWMKTEFKSMTPRLYVRDRILIEYLLDIEQMNILEVINDNSIEPEILMDEIRNYSRKKK